MVWHRDHEYIWGQARPARGRACRVRSWTAVALCALVLVTLAGTRASASPLRLTLSGTVAFEDQSPDLVPILGPETITVGVTVRSRPGTPWTLTLVANSDLYSGPDVIPIGNVSWTANPDPPFHPGVLSSVVPVLVGQGVSHERVLVDLDFYLVNSWGYRPGSYTCTATFTLASP